MSHFFMLTTFLQLLWTLSSAQETYGALSKNEDDDSLYLFSDIQSFPEKSNGDIENRRRSTLDKNFLRFGRSGDPSDLIVLPPSTYDFEYEDYPEEFARSTRSQIREKNDNFIRFGRSKSDFAVLGLNPPQYERAQRNKGQNFIRFGRSESRNEASKKRFRRDLFSNLNEHKRRDSNFVRFGRNEHFMRFGRHPTNYEPRLRPNFRKQQPMGQSLIAKLREGNVPLLHLFTEIAQKVEHDN